MKLLLVIFVAFLLFVAGITISASGGSGDEDCCTYWGTGENALP